MHFVEALEEKEQRTGESEAAAEKRLARYREWAIALTLTLGAFLVRAVYVFLFTNYSHYLYADMGGYWIRAMLRLHGATDYSQWNIWPPAYHLVLTELFRALTILGVPQPRWLALVLILQMVASSLSVYGVFRLGRIILPPQGLRLPAALTARLPARWGTPLPRAPLAFGVAALYGLSYPLIYFSAFVLTENVALPLVILATCRLLSPPDEGKKGFQSARQSALTGVLLGIAVALRPAYLLFVLAFAAYAFTCARRQGASLRPALALLGGAAALVLGTCATNAVLSKGQLVGLGGNGGVNFYMTQCKVRAVSSIGDHHGGHWIFGLGSSQYGPEEMWRPTMATKRPIDDQPYFYGLGLKALLRPATWLDDLWETRKLFYGPMFPSDATARGFALLDPLCKWGLGTLLLLALVLPPLAHLRGYRVSPEGWLFWSLLLFTVIMGFFFASERRYGYSVLFVADLSLLSLWVTASEQVPELWRLRAGRTLRRQWRAVARTTHQRNLTEAADVSPAPTGGIS